MKKYLLALLVTFPSGAADAHYRHYVGPGYNHYDQGAVLALGLFGAFAEAAIASSYGYVPYAYAPPIYYYQPACNPGFYWTGSTCWPY
jgi:hypothetical protein